MKLGESHRFSAHFHLKALQVLFRLRLAAMTGVSIFLALPNPSLQVDQRAIGVIQRIGNGRELTRGLATEV